MRLVLRGLAIFGVIFTLIACGRAPGEVPKHLEGIDFPDWVIKSTGAFDNDGGRVFHGVGSVNGIKNHALAVSTADNRARAEIAKLFEVYSAQLMKDYMSSTTAGDFTASSEEQHVEQATKTFAAATLSGVQIIDHWFHPVDGSVYALARLDLEEFTDSLEKMKELNEQVREHVRKNAERVHMDLENEEAKRQ